MRWAFLDLGLLTWRGGFCTKGGFKAKTEQTRTNKWLSYPEIGKDEPAGQVLPNNVILTLLACLPLNTSSVCSKKIICSSQLFQSKVTRIACSHSIPNIAVGSNCWDKGEGKGTTKEEERQEGEERKESWKDWTTESKERDVNERGGERIRTIHCSRENKSKIETTLAKQVEAAQMHNEKDHAHPQEQFEF